MSPRHLHKDLRIIWLRAVIYLCIVAGGWLLVLPLIILTLEHRRPMIWLRSLPCVAAGMACGMGSLLLALVSGYHLITYGHGTPLPLDPTRELVTSGPYRVVRNPQAIAITLAAVAEVLVVRSQRLWLLLPLTLAYLELIASPWEERQLRTKHSEKYMAYKRRVRKWIPRRTRHQKQLES